MEPVPIPATGTKWPCARANLYLRNLKEAGPAATLCPTSMLSPANQRRWRRHIVDLPLRVTASNGIFQTAVPGRGTEISEGGMAIYAGIPLQPGDQMEIELLAPCHTRLTGIVRNRTGYCYGLEFHTPLRS